MCSVVVMKRLVSDNCHGCRDNIVSLAVLLVCSLFNMLLFLLACWSSLSSHRQGLERSQGPHCWVPWAVPCMGHPSPVLALQLQLLLWTVHGADRCCLLSQGKGEWCAVIPHFPWNEFWFIWDTFLIRKAARKLAVWALLHTSLRFAEPSAVQKLKCCWP